jgi:transcription antitermination factor NusG
MKNFLAIYIGSGSSPRRSNWDTLEEAARRDRMDAGIKAWGNWMNAHKKSIVATGTPLGKTKRTSSTGIADARNNMTGYVIVQAETHEEAARMFENHPHFAVFPGESVEIMECLPVPGQ